MKSQIWKSQRHLPRFFCFFLFFFLLLFAGCGTDSSNVSSLNSSLTTPEHSSQFAEKNEAGGKRPGESEEERSYAEGAMTEQNPQTLFLGQYIQESGADAKPQPIEWLVLDRVILEDSSSERGSAEEIGSEEMSPDETGLENYSGREALLLVSRYALDSRTICQEYGETTWMECDLRTWLQTDFFENAFTPEEQDRILRLPVLAQANPEFDTAQGEDTLDRIFLLSIPEVEKYFLTEEQMRCAPTPYAAEKLSYENDRYRVDGKGSCWWWLRTMGADPTSVSLVRIEGTVFANGHFVDSESGCIRPAMWVLIS